jgi:Zinc knuckle/Retrotransposon gag protein
MVSNNNTNSNRIHSNNPQHSNTNNESNSLSNTAHRSDSVIPIDNPHLQSDDIVEEQLTDIEDNSKQSLSNTQKIHWKTEKKQYQANLNAMQEMIDRQAEAMQQQQEQYEQQIIQLISRIEQAEMNRRQEDDNNRTQSNRNNNDTSDKSEQHEQQQKDDDMQTGKQNTSNSISILIDVLTKALANLTMQQQMKTSTVKAESNTPSTPHSSRSSARKPDDFNGDYKSDVERWIAQMETWLKLEKIEDNELKLLHTSMYLKDAAELWTRNREFTTFDEFKSAIINRFKSHEKARRAADELDNARQIGSVEKYAQFYQQRVNMLSGDHKLNDSEQIRKFKKGLIPQIQALLMMHEFNNLDECIATALKCEHNLKLMQPIHKQNNQQRSSTSPYSQRQMKFNNKSNNHSKTPIRFNNEANNTESSPGSSSGRFSPLEDMSDDTFSDIEGHNRIDNDKYDNESRSHISIANITAAARRHNTTIDNIKLMMKSGKCFKCGQHGHISRDCTESKNAQAPM